MSASKYSIRDINSWSDTFFNGYTRVALMSVLLKTLPTSVPFITS